MPRWARQYLGSTSTSQAVALYLRDRHLITEQPFFFITMVITLKHIFAQLGQNKSSASECSLLGSRPSETREGFILMKSEDDFISMKSQGDLNRINGNLSMLCKILSLRGWSQVLAVPQHTLLTPSPFSHGFYHILIQISFFPVTSLIVQLMLFNKIMQKNTTLSWLEHIELSSWAGRGKMRENPGDRWPLEVTSTSLSFLFSSEG